MKQKNTAETNKQNTGKRELWCDFDGVIVCNELHGINTSEISPEEFVELVTKAYQENPVTSPMVRELIAEYRREGDRVNIITGRKRSRLSALTEQVLKDHGIKVDKIYYYPEENAYIMADYYGWKETVIKQSIDANPGIEARVIDDDRGLLEHLQSSLSNHPLELTHYEFFKDGSHVSTSLTT